MVALDAVRGLAESTASLNEGAYLSDPNGLNQGLLDRLLCRYEDSVHRIVRESYTNMPVVQNQWDVQLFQILLWPDSAQHQQLWAAKRTR